MALGLAFGLSVGALPAASAATFTVTNLSDLGVGSLRDAITQANATGGADIVDFQPGLTGTITLASEIPITDSVTITGPGAASMNITTSGTGRALHITGTPAVTISGLTFTGNGTATVDGAAIRLFGTQGVTSLTIQNSVFTNNVTTASRGGALFLYDAGAINITNSTFTGNQSSSRGGAIKFYKVGPVTVSGSTISSNTATSGRGGGMFFYKTTGATVSNSTISGNTASRGGGMFFYKTTGATTVVDSTISGNTATFAGGGIFFYTTGGSVTVSRSTISGNTAATQGGGLFFYEATGTSTISDSTISGNTATSGEGGAIVLYDQSLTINNSTVTGNNSPGGTAGGLYLTDSPSNILTLNSTIIANSTEQGGGTRDIVLVQGTVNASNSLVQNATGVTFGVNTANIFGQNPLLGALANNGGPTLTHALLNGSPAIDTGSNPTALAFDQRGAGFARTSGSATDIGAFEIQGAPPPPPVSVVGIPTLSQWGIGFLSVLMAGWAMLTGFGRQRRR